MTKKEQEPNTRKIWGAKKKKTWGRTIVLTAVPGNYYQVAGTRSTTEY